MLLLNVSILNRSLRIFYPLHLNSWEIASISPFECSVLNKGTTGTIFITSLVWLGPWLGIEPGTSSTRSQCLLKSEPFTFILKQCYNTGSHCCDLILTLLTQTTMVVWLSKCWIHILLDILLLLTWYASASLYTPYLLHPDASMSTIVDTYINNVKPNVVLMVGWHSYFKTS